MGEEDIHRKQIEVARNLAAKQERADLRHQMRDKRGRRFVWGILERAGVFRSSFNVEPIQMAFNEGRRNEGLRLLAMIQEECPELYSMMATEAKEDEQRNRNDATRSRN